MKKSISLLGILATLLGCHRNQEGLKLSGPLEWTEYNVGARVPGRVDRLFVTESDRVTRGQLLATLDRHAQAEKDAGRAERLFRQGGGSEQSVEQARLALDDQAIHSPTDGVVMLKVHEEGEVVSAGAPVLVLGDPSAPWVRVYVPENHIANIKLGQKAELRFDGIEQPFQGRVSSIAPRVEFTPRNIQTPDERVTQTVAVKVLVDNPTPALRPGLTADVTLAP